MTTSRRPLNDASLKQRLSLGATSKPGARGSLTRCATLLHHWSTGLPQDATTQNGPSSSNNNIEQSVLVRELQLARLEMGRLVLQHDRCATELHHDQTQAAHSHRTEQDLKDAREQLRQLRTALHREQTQQSCRREYESLATICVHRYAVPTTRLQQELLHVEQEHRQLQQQLQQADAELRLRQAQFHHVLQSLWDWRKSLTEPVEATHTTVTEEGEERQGNETREDMMVEVDGDEEVATDNLYTDL